MLATGSLGSVVRKPNRSAVSTPVFILRTQVHPAAHIPAKTANGRSSEKANHTSPLAALLNSLKLVKGTRQRFAGPSQRCQCLLAVLRMFVVPASGSRRSSSLKSTGKPLASSFAARFFAASISANWEDGMPHRAIAISRAPSALVRTMGAS